VPKIAAMGAVYRQKPSDLGGYIDLGAEIMLICEGSAAAAA